MSGGRWGFYWLDPWGCFVYFVAPLVEFHLLAWLGHSLLPLSQLPESRCRLWLTFTSSSPTVCNNPHFLPAYFNPSYILQLALILPAPASNFLWPPPLPVAQTHYSQWFKSLHTPWTQNTVSFLNHLDVSNVGHTISLKIHQFPTFIRKVKNPHSAFRVQPQCHFCQFLISNTGYNFVWSTLYYTLSGLLLD